MDAPAEQEAEISPDVWFAWTINTWDEQSAERKELPSQQKELEELNERSLAMLSGEVEPDLKRLVLKSMKANTSPEEGLSRLIAISNLGRHIDENRWLEFGKQLERFMDHIKINNPGIYERLGTLEALRASRVMI